MLCTGVPQASAAANTTFEGSLQVYETRPRVSSQCMRELSLGKLIVKQEDIVLLDNIGEGRIYY